MEIYKQKVVREVTGLGASLLSAWLKAGYIVPHYVPTRRGHHAGYSVTNMVQLQVMDLLANAGVILKHGSRITKAIENVNAPLYYNMLTGEHWVDLKSDGKGVQPPDWSVFMVVKVGKIRGGIEQKLKALGY